MARELLSDEAAADPDLDLGQLLGGKPREFTVGYKVLEDRGERRALLLADPEISTEYVLLVEVFVDVTRIESALDAAGLLLRGARGGRRPGALGWWWRTCPPTGPIWPCAGT